MTEINYVVCEFCNSSYDRRVDFCKPCNNSGFIPDPKDKPCNNCGGSLTIDDSHCKQAFYGLIDCRVSGSYSSWHLLDSNTYTFSLCEFCLRNMFKQFKVKPKMGCYMGEESSFEEDDECYDYRIWKHEKKDVVAYQNGLCNRTMNCPNKAIYTFFKSGSFSEDCACEEHKDARRYQHDLHPFVPFKLKAFI